MSRSQDVCIVGSGIAGIATSIRLAASGYRVKIFEASSTAGGKLNEFYLGPYRFDLGPSLFTMPTYVDELYHLTGRDPRHYYQYRPLEHTNNYFFSDGFNLKGYTDPLRFAEEVNTKLDVPAERIRRYLEHSDFIKRYTQDVFLNRSLSKLSTYFRWGTLQSFLRIPRMDIFKTMHEANVQRLKHPKLVQLFNRFATYNGSNPYAAPGILNIIPGLEHLDGVYFPKGGMYSITKGLLKLADELGVEIHLNERVEQIEISNGHVKSVRTTKSTYPSEIVVSNSDIVPTFRRLLKDQRLPEKILGQERSSSAIVFYWGINRPFSKLELHNIFFSGNYPEEFRTLFKDLDISDDPTVYINITSKEHPDDAPPSHENWFVMVNAPYNNGQDWAEITARTRKNVIRKLSKILKCDLEKHIQVEEILDPIGIESKTSSFRGSLYGTSSNSRMAAFFRHANFSKHIKGLYFCGGSVHPGGGIPLCLLSAKITSSLIID